MLLAPSLHAADQPKINKGLLDLSEWNFKRDGPVYLVGEAEFFWTQHLDSQEFYRLTEKDVDYLQIPASWNGDGREGHGYATYRINILIGPARPLTLKIPDIGTSYNLLIDGKQIYTVGRPGVTKDTTVPKYYPSLVQISPSGQRVELILQVSNFHHRLGGAWLPILIGEPDQVAGLRENQIARDLLLFGALLMIGLYNIVLYLLRRQDPTSLFLGLFCLLLATRTLTVGDRILARLAPNLTFEWFIRIEYITWFLAVPAFAAFLTSVFPRDVHRGTVLSIYAIFGIATLLLMVLPPELSTQMVLPIQILTVTALALGSYWLVLATIRKRDGAPLLMFSYLVLFYASVSDMLVNAGLIRNILLLDIGLFVFVFCQSMLISYRFTRSFKTIDSQRRQLQATNLQLRTQQKLRHDAESESKSLQDRIEQTEKLNSVRKLVSEITTDLDNTLNKTVLYPELALMELEESHQLNEPLNIIRNAGLHAAALARDLITLTRDGSLRTDIINVNEIISDILAEQSNHKITTNFAQDLHAIEGSPTQLRKLLLDLIETCSLLRNDDSTINLSTYNEASESKSLFYGELHAGEYVIISLEESGLTIPHEDLDKLFDPTRKINLSLVSSIVISHGGLVDVFSIKGFGTIFDLYFPSTSQLPVRRQENSPASAALGHGEEILIVEGAKDQTKLLELALSRLNYKIQICQQGDEAVAALNHFDLIIIDSDTDGYSAITKLQEQSDQNIILLSSDPEVAQDFIGSPQHRIISKPFTLSELAHSVAEIFKS